MIETAEYGFLCVDCAELLDATYVRVIPDYCICERCEWENTMYEESSTP